MSKMNEPLDHYGRMANTWWKTHRPTELREMTERAAFLAEVSSEVQAEITIVQAELQANLPAERDYLDRVAAIRTTQLRAEELVLAEWFPEAGDSPRVPRPRG